MYLNTVDNVDALEEDVESGQWDAVLKTLSGLHLPQALVIDIFEQVRRSGRTLQKKVVLDALHSPWQLVPYGHDVSFLCVVLRRYMVHLYMTDSVRTRGASRA